MSVSRHLEALSAFQNDDPLVAGLQSKISTFQRKQKKQAKQSTEYYDWVNTQRSLNDAEEVTTTQVLQTCSNVVELLQKEKKGSGCDSCSQSRDCAIKSIQDDMELLQKPAQVFSHQEEGVMPSIADLRHTLN